MKNLIFICVFLQDGYLQLLYLLLESIYIYGNLDDNTKILIYTSTFFERKIRESGFYSDKILFQNHDGKINVDYACKSRLDLFDFPVVKEFDKVLYIDTDILVHGDLNKIFDLAVEDLLYAQETGTIEDPADYFGLSLFGETTKNYEDKSAFNSGVLLFHNSEKMKELFNEIRTHMENEKRYFSCYDQPFIVYNAMKNKLSDNKKITPYVSQGGPVIYHYYGGVGVYHRKLEQMTKALALFKENDMKESI